MANFDINAFVKHMERKTWMEENGVTEYTKRIDLPKNEWYTCPSCDGKKSYYMSGDLHKSGGIVPCNCGDGLRKYRVETRYKVKAKSSNG